MNYPNVSFVVPCYKLAHLLRECIESILGQTYSDLEVLIMDDCSPDNTPEVVRSFHDQRVRYIRNETNLGHLRNYNKGIRLSCGRYVWLISADDCIRKAHAVERYVHVMDTHPEVGYVFCPAIAVRNGVENGLIDIYHYGNQDRIFDGREFIATVLYKSGGLASPSVMVRRDCYEKVSLFPLDMPHQGDMYLWFVWALEYDVAYFSEPMVNYRLHDLSMMKHLLTHAGKTVFADEVNVLWSTKRRSETRFPMLARRIEFLIARQYALAVTRELYNDACSAWPMNTAECEQELRANSASLVEFARLRAMFFALVAERQLAHRSIREAKASLSLAGEYSINQNPMAEILKLVDWQYTEQWKVAEFRLSAARIYWCQGKFAMGILMAIQALMSRPRMIGRPFKQLTRKLLRKLGRTTGPNA